MEKKLYKTKDVAAACKCSTVSVLRYAQALGLNTTAARNRRGDFYFSEDDLRRIYKFAWNPQAKAMAR
jgi:DNA-binding transcriptional MerR regulator